MLVYRAYGVPIYAAQDNQFENSWEIQAGEVGWRLISSLAYSLCGYPSPHQVLCILHFLWLIGIASVPLLFHDTDKTAV